AEAGAGPDDLRGQHGVARFAKVDLRSPRLHVPALVLHAMELKAERMPGADEQELPRVRVRVSPDQLPAPRFLDLPRVELEAVEVLQVQRSQSPLHRPILRR